MHQAGAVAIWLAASPVCASVAAQPHAYVALPPLKPFLLSLFVGVIVGLFYAAVKVRSPAPPLIALVGLLGMVVGEAAWPRLATFVDRILSGG